ncbi:MAG: hypothetical protein KA250_00725 [Verrucomicrobiales bacterium]|nr:hypothetical protein [Verrucomicrobiales bacterium]MBP9224229.1 hypothetical protein [Verrucomicrobiales bacterium]
MLFPKIFLIFLPVQILACSFAKAEDPSFPPYDWPESPRYNLRLDYAPIPGWKIDTLYRGEAEALLRASALDRKRDGVKSKDNPVAKGMDENLYVLEFNYDDYLKIGGSPIREKAADPSIPVFLGWDFNDFSTRFHRWTGERGLSRKYVIPGEFSGFPAAPLDMPHFQIDPESPDADWERFLLPVVTAEGDGDYSVINAFDKAGMTVGFIQLAAHTPDDLIPLMRDLVGNEDLRKDPYANPARWFPELGITDQGKLGYRLPSGELTSLEECTRSRNSNDGFSREEGYAYYREDFVRFCNPNCKEVNQAELQFAARWLMWSMSPKMRAAQLEPSKNNVIRTLHKLKDVPRSVSAADAAIAAVVLHWNDGGESLKRVSRLLNQPSPVEAFFSLESIAGQPDAESTYGKMLSKQRPWFSLSESDRQIMNQRVEAVRLLFEKNPALLSRLRSLRFDFETGKLQ